MNAYIFFGIVVAIIIFAIYLILDFVLIKGGVNQFLDKWARKTVWIWLPFYALQRLIKEVIFKK